MGGRLAGKVAIISGAGRGMGAATADLFAREGACVAILDIDEARADDVAAKIISEGGRAIAVAGDVSHAEVWARSTALVAAEFKRIDILVNNAGICPNTLSDQIDAEEWDHVQAVNLRGAFLGTRAVLPYMKEQQDGAIVNIASIAARTGFALAHYSASKAGLVALTRVTAVGEGKYGIRANSVLPGPIATAMLELGSKDAEDALKRAVPLQRFGQPNEVANAVLFLASDEARYISGAELTIDGALTLSNSLWA